MSSKEQAPPRIVQDRVPILLPPRARTVDGRQRRVGVEVEFAELDPQQAAALVVRRFGGAPAQIDPHRCDVRGSTLGDWTIQLDLSFVHKQEPAEEPRDVLDEILGEIRVALGHVGKLLMPNEVAAPPVPFDGLTMLDELVADLRSAGAVGTEGGLLYAFGLHFNPEVASFEPAHLLSVLRAYLLASPWLRAEGDIDTTRRLSSYIDPFPDDYAALVLDPRYAPDLDQFVDDYLDANPSRNRELDLFPLFAHIAPIAFGARIEDRQVRPRPTWHWRLPNSRVGVPGWSILPDWNRWVAVERLAEDAPRLAALARLHRDRRAEGMPDLYLAESRAWIEPLAR
jgi:Putative amidoligase enzyme